MKTAALCNALAKENLFKTVALAKANRFETNKTKQNKTKSLGFVPRQNKTQALVSQPLKNVFLSCFFFLCGKPRLFNSSTVSFQQTPAHGVI